MNKSFHWQLTKSFIVILMFFLSLSFLISYFIFKDFYLSEIEENLTNQAYLAADLMAGSYNENDNNLQQLSNKIARNTNIRVTVIDSADGKVLTDSGFDSNRMESHKNRPEIFQALKGETGIDIRYSNTANIYMLYVAVPVTTDSLSGVVRLAKPIIEIENVLIKAITLLLIIILLTVLAAFIISAVFARRFSQRLIDITETVKDIAQGNFNRRVTGHFSNQEFEGLSSAVNSMAAYLEKYVQETTEFKSQLEAVLDNTVNGIVMIDVDGIIKYVNPVAKALLFSGTDPLHRKHVEVISNYEIIAIIDRLRKNPEPTKNKIALYSKNKTIDINALPVSTVTGIPNDSILLVLNDITEITRLEQVRKDFIANVTHELKTPVASISGFAETMMSDKVESEEEFHEFSQIIYQESQRLTKLINDLFELSRLENANEKIPRQLIDIVPVIEETIKLIAQKSGVTNNRLSFVHSPEPVFVCTNQDSVRQIIINLLDNAIKFSEPENEIEIRLEEKTDEIIVAIIDQGDGIPEKEQSRIFERFYRIDQDRSRKTGGTGLGLSIVRHLVERLGGRMGVDSTPGVGSRFYFILPRD